ncbi:MAG: hypothetical protein JSV50_20875 [Desulfobacteraceae bacterium]|nr:MAG: hypothetical protein JSV50_20875 [Desulfobacteraceae bacterium]
MNTNYLPKLLIMLSCILFLFFLYGCHATGGDVHVGWGSKQKPVPPPGYGTKAKGGPPPHAPAHGYRAKYTYRYYPSEYVYFDNGRGLYFYLEGDQWRMSVSLPSRLHVRLGDYVTIGMDSDKPYTHFEDHKRKHPPGKIKKKKKGKKY